MLQLIAFAILITLIVIGIGHIRQLPAQEQRKRWWQLGSGLLITLLIFLVITGRMHWVGALIGALIPFVRGLIGLLTSFLPLWLKRKPANTSDSADHIQEALDILGLKGDFNKGEITEDMILQAHRHLIQKLHPDRGGNDYLATKINQARDLLINTLNNR